MKFPDELQNLALEREVIASLRRIARDERVKAYIESDKTAHDALLGAALRFVGGEDIDTCFSTVTRINDSGHAVTVDFMGESTRDEEIIHVAVDEFLQVIRRISTRGLRASVSLDLSHIGLVVDRDLTRDNASRLLRAARDAEIEVMISMEGSERTDIVLETYRDLAHEFENVGITVQANLHRTSRDLDLLLDHPGKVRIVKGAFGESEEIALPRGEVLNGVYLSCVNKALQNGKPVSISTHDTALISDTESIIEGFDLSRIDVEFEMLYGVCFDLLERLRSRGQQTKIYLPYGREWYLYLCHRLAEHPPNIYRALSDAVTYSHAEQSDY